MGRTPLEEANAAHAKRADEAIWSALRRDARLSSMPAKRARGTVIGSTKPSEQIVLEAWQAMAFVRTASKLPSMMAHPELRAAITIAEASLLALLRELTRRRHDDC